MSFTFNPFTGNFDYYQAAPGSAYAPPSSDGFIIDDDFLGDYNGGGYIVGQFTWRCINNGSPTYTCAGATIPSVSGHNGVLQITVTAASTDIGAIATGSFNNNPNKIFFSGNGAFVYDVVFKINALSDGTNNAACGFGFLDNQLGSAPSNAIYYIYQKESSLNWQCITEASSTATTTTTTTAVTAGWHHAQIAVNAAGSSVAFTMDGTVIATNTTNIPAAGIQAYFGYRKTLGASAMQVGIDKLKIYTTLSAAR